MSDYSDHLNSLIKEHNSLAKLEKQTEIQAERSPRQNQIRQELVKMLIEDAAAK
ncbi:MAG TPA: hypothetical protein VM056_02605 [Terriglobales bacterium]|nr:hypothetical protein [Terriglobales bacterium]